MSVRRGYTAKVLVGILEVLADTQRATIHKIAEDIGCHPDTVRIRIKLDLLPRRLVEQAGTFAVPGAKRAPMTYRIGSRLRTQG